ncbi:Mitotic-spindle organizing gamma-tubulin ring associated protein [Spironucleus salmonicida]|uniref:Mitotic-spindle organizing gamma-tubulin ring associated protein n=1 Tax=Spironucleus salmonicida TaxID=348837 RepID=V6LLS1_9EUKA|nr:Mitotic-spindle organizing gamma-tubulin ring associated protein [Spironucleus salmonicida]|eukprot:EST45587.1 hypothetical protein SS50377_14433 [Spironucleus salmonicida]
MDKMQLFANVDELCKLLNIQLNREQIASIYELVEAGINPEALIAAISDFK